MRYIKTLFTLGIAILGLLFLQCGHDPVSSSGGTDTGNALVMGHIYKGNSPAIGAKVFFVPVGHNPNPAALGKALASTDTVTTDSTGTYGTNDLDSGTYNVFGQDNSGNLSLIDSVHVTGDSQVVPPDTLKLPGSLAGFIKMQGRDDPASVLIMPFGTFIKPDPTFSTGAFSLANLAEGRYSIRFMSVLDRYEKLDTTFTITAGQPLTLPDSIRLPLKIPTPTGFKITYDTLKQIVTISWDKADTSRVKGYNVYRQRIDTSEVKLNAQPLFSPLYVDSTGIQDQTYFYSVVAVDFENKEGIRTVGDSVKIVSAFQFLKAFGSAGTGDGQFNEPGEMTVDSLGNVYVLDPFNIQGKIHKFSNTGVLINTWVAGAFDELRDIEINGDTLYVLDRRNKRIKIYNTAGDSLGCWSFSATTDPLNFSLKKDHVFILDRQNNQILKYSLAGDSLSEWIGIGGNRFKALKAIATSSNTENIYLLDSDSLGYVVDSMGNLISQFKIDQRAIVAASSQWFLLKSGNLIYSAIEKHTVFVIGTSGNMVAQFGEYGSANGQFKWPVSVMESASKIYISDAQNNRIQVFKE